MSTLAFGLVILILSASHSQAMSCPKIVRALTACKPFLVGGGPSYIPNIPYCLGVEEFSKEFSSSKTRMDLCQCVKNWSSSLAIHINSDKAKQIPQLCEINEPIPTDPNMDCTKY